MGANVYPPCHHQVSPPSCASEPTWAGSLLPALLQQVPCSLSPDIYFFSFLSFPPYLHVKKHCGECLGLHGVNVSYCHPCSCVALNQGDLLVRAGAQNQVWAPQTLIV